MILKKQKISDSVFLYDTVFMAPSSKTPLPELLVTSSRENHRKTGMLTEKLATDLLTSEALEKLLSIPPMPHLTLLLVPWTAIIITKPSGYSLFLQVSLEFSISLAAERYGTTAAQSPEQWLQWGARPEFRKSSWPCFQVPARKATCSKMLVITICTPQKYFCHTDEKNYICSSELSLLMSHHFLRKRHKFS